MSLTLSINGEAAPVQAELHDTLLSVLRDRLHLTATKRGCNQGVCGACTVSVDGVPVRACLSLAHGCEGAQVRTLEGLNHTPRVRALQRALAAMRQRQAGARRPAVDVDGAGAAHALVAAALGRVQLQLLAQHAEQRVVQRRVDAGGLAVDLQGDAHALTPMAASAARTARSSSRGIKVRR